MGGSVQRRLGLVRLRQSRRMTDPALKLLCWIKDHGSPNDWVKTRHYPGTRGSHGQRDCVGSYIKELRRKLGSAPCYEVEASDGAGKHQLSIKLG
jgi:hypothetical protein